ncbi:hypothetical protein ACI2LF_22235 [Kribbella sp. NPDC020789]
METLVAYAFHRPDSAVRAAEGAARVGAYYAETPKRGGHDGVTNGLHVWGSADRQTPWPAWRQTGDVRVASLHAPLGYERVVGDIDPADAPGPLAEAVRRTPEAFTELAPPFTMAVLDGDRLDLFTDSAGLGRLFQVRLPDGWVWSNRPVAALLFAGIPAAASPRGWEFAAACGWFMGDSTPYEGVLAVPAATHIVADGKLRRQTTTRIEPSTLWLTDRLDEPLPDLTDSVRRLWPAGPQAPETPTAPLPSLIDHALAWHRYSEGQTHNLFAPVPTDGEDVTVAYGHYYPADLPTVEALPLHAKLQVFAQHLERSLVPATGPSEAARATVGIQIEQVLQDAVRGGIEDAKMLDYFYLVERIRRTSTAGERAGAVSPQLLPQFVRAAFANALPVERPTTPLRRLPRPRRVAEAPDSDLIESMLLNVDGFDERALSTLWAASVAGASSAAAEATLQQALWRATFDLHLTEVNQHLPELVRPLAAPPRTTSSPQSAARPHRNRLARAFARRHAQ